MLRVGFVGSGLIAWAHGLRLKAMIDGGVVEAAIVAVHDQRERRASGFAEAVGDAGVAVVGDAAEAARRCDAVWVCTPTSAHRGGVDEALAAGCGRVLREAARPWTWPAPRTGRGGRRRRCGQPERARPAERAGVPGLRDLVAGGTLGAPMAAVFRDDQYFPIQGTYASQWRADVAPGRRRVPD